MSNLTVIVKNLTFKSKKYLVIENSISIKGHIMISYPVYLILHLAGIVLTLLSIGALSQQIPEKKKIYSITHGVGLLFVLVGGFGLMARTGISHSAWPAWIYIKLFIWLIFGASIAIFKRLPQFSQYMWWATWVLFVTAAYLAKFH